MLVGVTHLQAETGPELEYNARIVRQEVVFAIRVQIILALLADARSESIPIAEIIINVPFNRGELGGRSRRKGESVRAGRKGESVGVALASVVPKFSSALTVNVRNRVGNQESLPPTTGLVTAPTVGSSNVCLR